MSLLIKGGVTAHTALTDKEAAGVIDHADLSVADAKIASGVGLSDTQIAKLPTAAAGKVLKRGGAAWEALDEAGIAGVKARKNSQMPIIGTRPQLNLIEGASIGLTVEDNPSDTEIDITISAKYPTQFIPLIPETAVLPVANPAALVSVDGANFSYKVLDFDATTEESCFWDWFLTPDYLLENIEAYIYWISTGAGNVKFGVRTLGRQTGDTWDAALGTEQTVVQANAGAGITNVAKINSFAPGWAANQNVLFKLARKAADALDTLNADARVLKVVVRYTGQFAQSFYPLATPVQLTGLVTGSWQDKDVSAYIPAGATGVIIHAVNLDDISRGIGFRKKGSTDNRTQAFANSGSTHGHMWVAVGINESRIFQYYIFSTNEVLYLVGYTATGVTFHDNAYDKTPPALTGWQTVSCAAEAPGAIGLIFEKYADVGAILQGERKTGSTDSPNQYSDYHVWAIIGCDGSQQVDLYKDNTQIHYFLIGYVTSGAIFLTNAVNKSPAAEGSYVVTDCSASAPSAVMLFFRIRDSNIKAWAIRKNGSTEDIYVAYSRQAFAMVACDSAIKVEIKTVWVLTAPNGVYLVGYATWAGA